MFEYEYWNLIWLLGFCVPGLDYQRNIFEWDYLGRYFLSMIVQAVVFFSFTVLLHYQVLPERVVRYFQVLTFNFFYHHLKMCWFSPFFMNIHLFCFDLLTENTTSTTIHWRWRCCSWTRARWADRWWVNWWTTLTTTYKSETFSLLRPKVFA